MPVDELPAPQAHRHLWTENDQSFDYFADEILTSAEFYVSWPNQATLFAPSDAAPYAPALLAPSDSLSFMTDKESKIVTIS